MNEQLHKENINDIITEYGEMLKEAKSKQIAAMISFGITIISTIAFFISGFGDSDLAAGVFLISIAVGLISAITAAVLAVKADNHIKNIQYEKEEEFYSLVYAGMISDEINGEHHGTYIQKQKKQINKNLGEIIEGRSDTFQGVFEGKKYTLSSDYAKIISQIKTKDGSAYDYKTDDVFSGTDLSIDSRRETSASILLKTSFSAGSENPTMKAVRMDDKRFKYQVYSNDEIAAFKYLTPGVMSDLNDIKNTFNVTEIKANGNDFIINVSDRLIQQCIRFNFKGSAKKMQKKYTYENIYQLTHPQALNVIKLIRYTLPVTGSVNE